MWGTVSRNFPRRVADRLMSEAILGAASFGIWFIKGDAGFDLPLSARPLGHPPSVNLCVLCVGVYPDPVGALPLGFVP